MRYLIIILLIGCITNYANAQSYTEQDYDIYNYVMETTSISTDQAKENMAKRYDLSVAEVDSIVSMVLGIMMSPNNTDKEIIKKTISEFSNPRTITASRDYALISYEQTFSAFNRKDVHRKTKQYMKEILEMVIEDTNIQRVRIAPYHPNAQGNGFIAVALLTISRDDYVQGRDIEQYDGFIWKN